MSPNQRRGPWSNAEDTILMNLVANQGALNWVRIASHLGTRTPKQCRERYHQNLKPTLNHDPITPEEGQQIEQLVHEIGKRWAEIARRLHGRSDNAVKNWWNGSQNRRKRQDRRRASIPSAHHYDDRAEIHYSRPVPRPLSPSRFNQQVYCIESPLLSPPALSPEADSEMAPSLLSDAGSCYTTSPRSFTMAYSPIELPPLKNQGSSSPRYVTSPTQTRLPGLSSLTFRKEDLSRSLPPRIAPQEHLSPKSHLPTAPNSPVGAGGDRQGRRMDVAALLA
ncbi:hypothetical protein NKR23_g7089 [Pleurostoma richardsiae]|uniref:Uncharacterized protein n=1 Tax=Pleurostoma richardsiae TaxID=41990 RepID=A0AA38RIY8_9PEZI|nr:hypothetical protein NKR23_g7089 [Pleurostoma richardsiae]